MATKNIATALSHVEAHLNEKLDLDAVAGGVCYSKYHLHRAVTAAVGIMPHRYIQRRRL